jgi:hypothetical protein
VTGPLDDLAAPAPEESNLGLLLRASRRRTWYSVVALMMAVGAAAGLMALNLGPSVPDGGPLAASQAAAIDSLLDSSAAGRARLLSAIDDINACAVDHSTVFNIRAAVRARSELAARVGAIVVSDLPNGVPIKSDLLLAVRASHKADRAYLAWVLAADGQCPTHADAAWNAVSAANATAGESKRALLARWNPVASKYGLTRRSATVI